MKERPILMSAPMVRATLDDRKTQTRRIAKEFAGRNSLDAILRMFPNQDGCSYGRPGDLLWLRETCRAEELASGLDGVRYLADGHFRSIEDTPEAAESWMIMNTYRGGRGLVVPAIHMPRWASRITLEIAGVRVERLNDISESDAMAEGWPGYSDDSSMDPMAWYSELWDAINGAGAWITNPWVWAIAFKTIGGLNG